MAGSDSSSGGASQLPIQSEATTITVDTNTKLPRRKLTLIAITILLNILLWSSFICLITTIYQIASDPSDGTNIPSEVLTLTSALATIAYIVLHTIFSLKQRIWKHQGRHPSIVKKTSYIAIRVSVTLCVLWLLTSGWNMITVARQPVCLANEPGLRSWEAGPTCRMGRAGVAFAMIALIASCTLFGMLSIVRRPFEAHLLKHGYRPPTAKPRLTPGVSRRPSPSRSQSSFSEKYRRGRVSASTHRSTPSNASNTDVETLDLNTNSPPPSILAPSPIRVALGLSIFNSHEQPPMPPPPTYAVPPRGSSLDSSPPIFLPSMSNQHLPPPRASTFGAPPGSIAQPIPAQYSASAWRAVHPHAPLPVAPVASQSNPHLPNTNTGYNFGYRSGYSRSLVSLTRPHRISTVTPAGSVGWSSRTNSTEPEDGRGSPASGSGGTQRKATSNEVAYAILHGTVIPGTEPPKRRASHVRHASAPDATPGSQQSVRMGMGWKPQLKDQNESMEPAKIVRSSSADLLSRFSPDNSPESDKANLRNDFDKDLSLRLISDRFLPVRKIRSADPIRHSDVPTTTTGVARTTTMMNRMSQNLNMKLPWTNNSGNDVASGAHMSTPTKKMTFDELKNKPLPKIAVL